MGIVILISFMHLLLKERRKTAFSSCRTITMLKWIFLQVCVKLLDNILENLFHKNEGDCDKVLVVFSCV